MTKAIIATLLTLVSLVSLAQAQEFVEGTHYQRLPEKLPTTYRGDEVGEIMEVFSYSCIHCFNLETFIQSWKQGKPDDIRFTLVPVLFNERQLPEARAYYVGEFLGLHEESHMAIYNEIHLNRTRMATDDRFASFFTRFGVSEEEYRNMANSFAVNVRINQAQRITQGGQVQGTPSLIVNGQYLVTGQMAGGNPRMFDVAEWLIRRDQNQ
ncbi:MAG: thiol:disulfide interchange protein DsbA/DsbL [Saccharospirillum sp.]|nr:thiol:disulfide interchange protein DsbA/DsbL [Saccharospirillum sp.]